MIEFIPIASGSAGNCYVVRAEGHQPLLIDPGIPFAELQRELWDLEINVSDCCAALCSHSHLDHCKAVAKLMAAGIDCYASRECWQQMGLAGHRAKVIGASQGQTTLMDKWQVYGFYAVHDEPGTLGFLVAALRGQLLYLTDSAYCPYRFLNLSHVAIECNYSAELMRENVMAGRLDPSVATRTIGSHSSIETVCAMLKANDLSKCQEVWLLHLSQTNGDPEAFRRQVQAATGVPVFIAGRRRKG